MKVTVGLCTHHTDRQHRFAYDYTHDLMICRCGVTMQDPNHPTGGFPKVLEVPPKRPEFPRGTRMMFYQSTPPDGWRIVGGPYYDMAQTAGMGSNNIPPAHILCEKE